MGSESIRITPEDFVTPPEYTALLAPGDLRGYQGANQETRTLAETGFLGRGFQGAGQIGGVRLELVASGGVTALGRCYQQVPVRVVPPFHFAGEPAALLYLINPTAGL